PPRQNRAQERILDRDQRGAAPPGDGAAAPGGGAGAPDRDRIPRSRQADAYPPARQFKDPPQPRLQEEAAIIDEKPPLVGRRLLRQGRAVGDHSPMLAIE